MLTADGYILTNNHVVDGADALEVVAEGETYKAKLVGTDPSSDLAVIKVDGATLKPIEIGNSSDLKVGEWVMGCWQPVRHGAVCVYWYRFRGEPFLC